MSLTEITQTLNKCFGEKGWFLISKPFKELPEGGDFVLVKENCGKLFIVVGDCQDHGLYGADIKNRIIPTFTSVLNSNPSSSTIFKDEIVNALAKLDKYPGNDVTAEGLYVDIVKFVCIILEKGYAELSFHRNEIFVSYYANNKWFDYNYEGNTIYLNSITKSDRLAIYTDWLNRKERNKLKEIMAVFKVNNDGQFEQEPWNYTNNIDSIMSLKIEEDDITLLLLNIGQYAK